MRRLDDVVVAFSRNTISSSYHFDSSLPIVALILKDGICVNVAGFTTTPVNMIEIRWFAVPFFRLKREGNNAEPVEVQGG